MGIFKKTSSRISELLEEIQGVDWLCDYKLPGGELIKSVSNTEANDFNQARKLLLELVLDGHYADCWKETSLIELSCKQGFFALPFAQKGARVTGIDANRSHINAANLMARALEVDDKFKAKRTVIEDVMPEKYGRYDVVLMMGFVYHLENPVAAIRTAFSVCKDMCLIETHVLSGQELNDKSHVSVVHCVDEPKGFEEIQSNDLCLVPNQYALIMMMEAVGFKQVEVVKVPADLNNGHTLKKRVLVIGHKS